MASISRRTFLSSAAGSALALGSMDSLAMTSGKKLGVALVGLGYYSTDLIAPSLQLTQHCELRGIVTGSPEKIPVWQKRYGVKDSNVYNYENMHTIANNPEIDVVYIILPTFLHKKYAEIAANAGKHVWCEKPMAMDENECQDMINACKKNSVKLSIGYRLQHEPNTQSIMQLAKSKPYGNQRHLICEAGYAGRGFPADNWKMFHSKGGGALRDMGVYAINAARYATGMEPVSISAKHVGFMPEKFVHSDEATEFTLEFAGGLRAKCAASQTWRINQLHVDCDKGWYRLNPMAEYTNVGGITSDGKLLNKTIANQQATQMDNDALAIINNTDVIVPGEEGLKDIRVVNAGLKSAKSNKIVMI